MSKVLYGKFKDIVLTKAQEEKKVSWEDFENESTIRLYQDLGLSSLDVMEIIMEIEELYGIHIDNKKIHDIYLLTDLWALFS